MAIFFIVVLILFVLIAGAALSSSPSWRFWSRGRGAVDPTGNPVSSSREFERPPNEGDLF
ncbi:MAG: hypothetical protein QOH76_1073 [Thermoleophilaceae bacterium]|jgi:hypothetical protein|nr:hypothetical protein [Thermoleophilaceae bacterium]